MPVGPMVHLTTVGGTFHGRLVAARLGAEGILTELRGAVDGPYPSVGPVEVYVTADQADVAREVLLADAVDAAFDDTAGGGDGLAGAFEDRCLASTHPTGAGLGERPRAGGGASSLGARLWQPLLAVAVLVALATVLLARGA